MENEGVLPKLLISNQATDTTANMFGVVDDVATNFADELAQAQSDGKVASKESKKEKKADEVKEEQPIEKKENSKKNSLQKKESSEKTPLQDQESTQSTTSLIDQKESPQMKSLPESLPPQKNDEVAEKKDPITESTDKEDTLLPETTQEKLPLSKTEQKTQLPDTPEKNLSKNNPAVVEEQLVQPKENKGSHSLLNKAHPQKEQIPAIENHKTAQQKRIQPKPTPLPLKDQIPPQENKPELHPQKEEPLTPKKPTLAEQIPDNNKDFTDKTSTVEIEGFHDIVPEQEQLQTESIPIETKEKILLSLANIAAGTKVQPPVPEQISPRIMKGLQTANAELARQIEKTHLPSVKPKMPLQSIATPTTRAHKSPYFHSTSQSMMRAQVSSDPFVEIQEKVTHQVRSQVQILAKTEKTPHSEQIRKVSIKLHPRFLGTIDVQLTIEESKAGIKFVVENQTVKELLQKSQAELVKSLESQELQLEEIEIDLADQHDNMHHGGKAFATEQEQQAARDWLASFKVLGLQEDTEEQQDGQTIEDQSSDDVVNILA